MKRIVMGDHVVKWAADRLGASIACPCVHWGHEIDGEIAGVVVFSDYTGANIEVTVAGSPKAWTRRFLRHLGKYVFTDLGCARVTIRTRSKDVAMLGCRLGGQIEGLMRDFYGEGIDALVVGILRKDWRLRHADA